MTDFAWTKAQFALPDGVTYLDGNSLGPLPRAAAARVARTVTAEWGEMLIGGWNAAGWMAAPDRLGDRIGRLIGAPPGTVTVGETLSIRLFQALSAALDLVPGRRVILTDTGNFPSDLYMAEGLARLRAAGHRVVAVAPEAVADALSDQVACLMLTEVDYRSGRRHDMGALTAAARRVGARTVWDLAHSAGALEVDVTGTGADFAVGCTYKYLNAGPGAPAFLYARPDLVTRIDPALPGWLGHAAPFAFEPVYRPGAGVARMRIGTPPVLQMAALDAALDVWDRVAMADVRARSIALSEAFVAGVSGYGLELASPRDPAARGSQISLRHPNGYAVMQALIAHGVIGDFRAPDLMRFGFAPLYNDAADVARAVTALGDVLSRRLWDRHERTPRALVT